MTEWIILVPFFLLVICGTVIMLCFESLGEPKGSVPTDNPTNVKGEE